MKFYVIKKQYLILAVSLLVVTATAFIWMLRGPSIESAVTLQPEEKIREIHLVTGEFKTTTETGQKIEAYRWDPGTILLEKNEKVSLNIYGVNGMEHPFMIEGTDIKGTVKQGEETVVPLKFKEDGVYRLICLTHPDKDSGGPMIAYIIVD